MFLFRSNKAQHEGSRERLSEYIDGRLFPEEAQGLEAHLEACPSCRQQLASLKATVALLRELPQVPAPRSFALRAEDVRRRPAPLPLFVPLRLATAATALLLTVVVAGDLLLPQVTPAPREASEVQLFGAGDSVQIEEAGVPEAEATSEAAPAPSLRQRVAEEIPWRGLELALFALLIIFVILILRIRKGARTAAWGHKKGG